MAQEISEQRFKQIERMFTKKCRSIARQFCAPDESAVAGYILFKIGLNSIMSLPTPLRLKMGERVVDDVKILFNQMQKDGELIRQISKMTENPGEDSDKA